MRAATPRKMVRRFLLGDPCSRDVLVLSTSERGVEVGVSRFDGDRLEVYDAYYVELPNVTSSSTPSSQTDRPELVAAAQVVDFQSRLRVPTLVIRMPGPVNEGSYNVGQFDIQSRKYLSVMSFSLGSQHAEAIPSLTDGPAVCVLVPDANGMGAHTLAVVEPPSTTRDDRREEAHRAHLRHVAAGLQTGASLLCCLSW